MPVSAPIFIPFMGALILLKRNPTTGWQDAQIGIGGPVFGTLAGMGFFGIYTLTGNPLFLGAAYLTFFINLFNMVPLYPLDGGRIVGCVSPYLWIGGLVILLGLELTGVISNPLIWILLILSVPNIIAAFRRRTTDMPGSHTTLLQKGTMSVCYVGLLAFLFVAVGFTREPARQEIRRRVGGQMATIQPKATEGAGSRVL
jgi:Zn-dependent protease